MSYVRRARSSTVRASPRTGRATSHRRGCHGWGAVKGGVRLSCMRSMGGHVCRFRIRAPGQGPFATAALMSDLLIVISTRSIAHRNRVLRAEDAWRYGVESWRNRALGFSVDRLLEGDARSDAPLQARIGESHGFLIVLVEDIVDRHEQLTPCAERAGDGDVESFVAPQRDRAGRHRASLAFAYNERVCVQRPRIVEMPPKLEPAVSFRSIEQDGIRRVEIDVAQRRVCARAQSRRELRAQRHLDAVDARLGAIDEPEGREIEVDEVFVAGAERVDCSDEPLAREGLLDTDLDGLARLDAQVLVADERIAQGIEARLLVAVRPASVQTGARSGMRIAQSQPTGDARIVIVGVIDAGRPVELETGLRAIACFDERRASDAIEIEIAGHDREAEIDFSLSLAVLELHIDATADIEALAGRVTMRDRDLTALEAAVVRGTRHAFEYPWSDRRRYGVFTPREVRYRGVHRPFVVECASRLYPGGSLVRLGAFVVSDDRVARAAARIGERLAVPFDVAHARTNLAEPRIG